jgi:hypothetical protein
MFAYSQVTVHYSILVWIRYLFLSVWRKRISNRAGCSWYMKRSVVTQMGSDSWYYILPFLRFSEAAFFAGSEIAYASVNKIRIKNYADNGDVRAKKALYILNNFDKSITTMLVGTI